MQLPTAVEHVSKVPFREIVETKRAFRPSKIDYEILVEGKCVWRCLAECAAVFSQLGLTCKSLRYGAQGLVYLRLQDDGNADLDHLHEMLIRATDLSIVSWTTVIGFEDCRKPGPAG